jgi:hypothetical protein
MPNMLRSLLLAATMRSMALLGGLLLTIPLLHQAIAAEVVAIGGLQFVNKGLVGVGRMPADLRDKFGETFGSGSSLAIDPTSWRRGADGFQGVFYLLPDRGYNVTGTTDYKARINKLAITLQPAGDPSGLPAEARQRTVSATLIDTIPLADSTGKPLSGLDPGAGIRRAEGGFPDLPQNSSGTISIDPEGMVLMPDHGFFISDEYGPYIYRFSAQGRLLSAIRPPEAFIPIRNGEQNFSSNNPGPGATAPKPSDPEFGRQNNQGFEGLTVTPGGKYLVAVLQSATRQDGGTSAETRRYTRILYYDISDPAHPVLAREHVVPLPVFDNAEGKRRVAAQSEVLALDENHFLLLCRDSSNGYGMSGTTSLYRRVEVLDTSDATNIAGSAYDRRVPVAPLGKLDERVRPAALTPFLDLNNEAELYKFGLHNGPPNDRDNLSEKWEGLGLAPALDPAAPRDYFLFVVNDNDFITQNGFQVGAPYRDDGGADVDTVMLVYRVTLPDFTR